MIAPLRNKKAIILCVAPVECAYCIFCRPQSQYVTICKITKVIWQNDARNIRCQPIEDRSVFRKRDVGTEPFRKTIISRQKGFRPSQTSNPILFIDDTYDDTAILVKVMVLNEFCPRALTSGICPPQ